MQPRSPRASYLLGLNWLLFIAASLWTCVTQGNLLWWLRLDWGSWLSDFSVAAQLGMIPAGSLWILWLMLTLLLTAIYLFNTPQRTVAVEAPAEPDARRQLYANTDLMDARPELKEKILRLHQSLDKI